MKVSPGCKNCYAETLDNRYNHENPHWGPNSSRKPMSEKYWQQPLKWDKEAAAKGVKAKVFCASMADVFEGHADTLPHLKRLFGVIKQTPNLIWQLLTKRPENINSLIAFDFPDGLPENVWIGTSVENQEEAQRRILKLMRVSAKFLFLSCEPLLGPLDITNKGINNGYSIPTTFKDGIGIEWTDPGNNFIGVDWVIVGGESGHGARPMHPEWVRSLRDQCQSAGVSFFFKQWGEWVSEFHPETKTDYHTPSDVFVKLTEDKQDYTGEYMFKVGKKKSGRLLDGREWNEMPEVKLTTDSSLV